MTKKPITHTTLGWVRDQNLRSKENWERGRGPRYTPKMITNKLGKKQKVYCLR